MINVWRCEKDKLIFILTDKANLDELPETIDGFEKALFTFCKSITEDMQGKIGLDVEQVQSGIAEHGYYLAKRCSEAEEIMDKGRFGQ